MNAAIIAIGAMSAFLLAYRFYARFLSSKIFPLSEWDDSGELPPSHEQKDGVDYVPTSKPILFGHHFSSIAGAAPIVGPAIAAIWGWLPALLWIVLGVIFLGATHDFGALVISMRNRGQSIGQVAEYWVGPRARSLILLVIFFLVWMVIAVFALVIANLFVQFPASVLPVNFEIIIAVILGYFINRRGISLTIPSLLAQGLLFVMIYLGTLYPLSLEGFFGENQLMAWIVLLMIYSYVASVLPVWALLQPRDFINSHQLFVGLTLMVLGLVISSPTVVAPAVNLHPEGAPPWFPFLFITIACGAISGFHGLVSGGTSSKQVACWKDARPVGYGSMLGEGFLAILATLAVTAGFDSEALWHQHYATWESANGLSAKISAFVLGAGKFISSLGIPQDFANTAIAVLIISFAATSLDTACRIQRYILAEVGEATDIRALGNRYLSSFIAIGSAFALMLTSEGGKGGLLIWPLFGATNQMLAGLTLVVICVYLLKNKKPIRNFLLPAIFVVLMTAWALAINMKLYFENHKWFLLALGILLFMAQLWIIAESFRSLKRAKVEGV